MNALDPKFAKVIALMRSSLLADERAAARAHAEILAAANGQTLAEVIAIVDAHGASLEAEVSQEDGHEYRDWAKRRKIILERYGDVETALAPCPRVEALYVALTPWRETTSNGSGGTTRIRGAERCKSADALPPAIRDAVAKAYALPRTVAEARAEITHWATRQREIRDIHGFRSKCPIDLAVLLRIYVLRALIGAEDAFSPEELPDRIRLCQDLGMLTNTSVHSTLARHAERLVELSRQSRSRKAPRTDEPSDQVSTSNGTEQIRAALEADATQSDRAISRACNCSPTTVGKIRKAMKLSSTQRTIRRGGQVFTLKAQAI